MKQAKVLTRYPMCWCSVLQQKIVVDVIGINDTTHKALTVKTGGLWFPIPKQL